MLNFDPALETRILKTVCNRKPLLLLSTLNVDWFGLPMSREIWQRINNLRTNGKPIPSSETLSQDPVLSEKSQALLKGDISDYGDTEMEQALEQLNYYRKGRVLFSTCSKITELLKDNNADVSKAKIEMERGLANLSNSDFIDDSISYGYENEKTLDLYEKVMDQDMNERFMKTGFKAIDNQQGGFGRGRLYSIGAPSGGGKSLLANQIAINAYRAGYSVNYNSFELGREECMLRTQANITRIPHDRFQLQRLTPEERKRSDKELARFLSIGLQTGKRLEYNCPSKDINIAQLFSQIEPLSFDLVIIDYINLMAYLNPKEALWWNIGEAFRLAKKFAERTRSALLMVVQRDEDTGDLKYAKSIKHHSDGVWVWPYTDQEKETGIVDIEQIKLRNFRPVKFSLQTEFEYCAWSESFGSGAQPTPTTIQPGIQPMNFSGQ